jgi:hypothetical protein
MLRTETVEAGTLDLINCYTGLAYCTLIELSPDQ